MVAFSSRFRTLALFCTTLVALLELACAGIRSYPRYTVEGSNGRGAMAGRHRREMESVIESFLGAPYRWSGEGRDGVDCSGLVVAVFRQALTVSLPHSTEGLFRLGEKVDRGGVCFGDLVFFGEKRHEATHVGICLGDGTFVHASKENGVTISRLDLPYFQRRYIGARRIVM